MPLDGTQTKTQLPEHEGKGAAVVVVGPLQPLQNTSQSVQPAGGLAAQPEQALES